MIDPTIQPHIWDYALLAFFALVMPAWMALHTLPKLSALSAAQIDEVRPRIYVSAMLSHWMMGAAAISPLLLGHADLTTLGLGFPRELTWRFAIALGLAVAVFTFIYIQRRRLMAMADGREYVLQAVRNVDWLLPKTQRERKLWVVVSLHAGVFEELFFRGYMLALLNFMLPYWAAVAISSVLFGLAHLYQGSRGIIGTTVVGLVMIGLYLLSGSLWVPMLLHAVYDMHGGELGRWALQDERADSTS